MNVTQWEYLTEIVNFATMGPDVHLDAFGEEGWELVHIGKPDTEGDSLCVFKRPCGAFDSGEG